MPTASPVPASPNTVTPDDAPPARRGRATPLRVARDMRAAWRRTAPFFGASRGAILALAAASLLGGLAEAVLLTLIAAAANAIALGESEVETGLGPLSVNAGLSTLFAIGIGLAVLRGALQILVAYLPAKMSANANSALRRNLFDAFTSSSWTVQSAERDGHFQSLINGHVSRACMAMIALGAAISSSLMLMTLLVAALALSVTTALIIIGVSVGLFVILRPLARRLRAYATELSAENVEFSKTAQEVVLMAEETQVFGVSDSYRQTFYAQLEKVRRPLLRTRFMSKGLPAAYQSLALLLVVVALAIIYVNGGAAVASMGAVVLLLIRSMSYGQQVQASTANLDELIPFMYRLGDAMDYYRANPRQAGDQPVPDVERIGLRDAHFAYVPGEDVLRGISFEAVTGEAVGIVGPSGAGKSSLVQLLLRLRDPDSGMLFVNDCDARTLELSGWQQQVAYVPQTPQLIYGTVAENIKYFREHLSRAEIQRAAERAHIHDEIMSWPQGYDTIVGQRASAVSGGQRQRLCLARALADSPRVLILDEPTSALDVKSEMLVQESLRELKGEVILFLVAHRLSTLSICNRVMVIVNGLLEAIGEPESLVLTNDFYREVTEITHKQANA
ncbi:MAG: ABC transporter ATP-binding protein/permease [Actinomycetia bacterium]|nr:ABC transporter ATP-binding protein/permease [Actinomycetes bacterium]